MCLTQKRLKVSFILKLEYLVETKTKRHPASVSVKAEGWPWRNVTTLRFRDSAIDATTDHPWYNNDSFNHVLKLYRLFTCTLFTHIGVKQANILGSDEVQQWN